MAKCIKGFAIESMRNVFIFNKPSVSIVSLVFISVCAFSYSGGVNPHPLGMLSTVFVSATLCSMLLMVGMLGRKLFFLLSFLLLSLFWVITVANWWHYQFFGAFFDWRALGFGFSIAGVTQAISDFRFAKGALFLWVGIFAPLGVAASYYSRAHFLSRYSMCLLAAFALVSLGLFSMLSGFYDGYSKLNLLRLKPAYFHPVQSFLGIHNDEEPSGNEDAAFRKFKSFNKVVSSGLHPELPVGNYNVLIVVLESFRASMAGHYNGGGTLTPNLDKIAANNVIAREFYANTNYTVKGETAIWCGLFDLNSRPPLSTISEELLMPECLPKILSDQGYQTIYFHGNEGAFYERDKFLPLVGFQSRYFHEDYVGGVDLVEDRIGWGISDEKLYMLAFDRLEQLGERRFFASITSLSAHYPFNWDWGDEVPKFDADTVDQDDLLYKDYQRAIFYSDYALGKLWERYKNSPLSENTILIITGDHGVWVFPSDQLAKYDRLTLNEHFFRMPFVLVHPAHEGHLELVGAASQIDIAPTILDLLGLSEYRSQFIGRNMLETVSNPWAIMMKQGDIVVRREEVVCYFVDAECSGIHQSCVSTSFGELASISSQKVCMRLDGDLLRGGVASADLFQLVEREGAKDILEDAFLLVKYDNKRVMSR